MILHPLLIAYDGIAEGVTEYLFLVSLFARKYDEKAFLTSSLVGWGVLLNRMGGLGLSGGGSLKSTQKGLLCIKSTQKEPSLLCT